ncbi:MAG TPA: imelysin family protein, partial [Polyangiaceae bacterium]|nr:imelysin family protein [Polyangiaceae bacterium]
MWSSPFAGDVKPMSRRAFVQALLGSALGALPACRKHDTRAEVLRTLIERVLVPNTAAVARESRQLELEMAGLAEPNAATLRAARLAWQRSLSSWKRVDAFRVGPISESNSLMRVMFWPARTAGIEALLLGTQPIDDASIDAMGVDRRGLFALEYLLFREEPEEQTIARFTGASGERRARLARALAANVSLYADKAEHSLGDGQAYANKFADGGQDSVNRLVAQLAYTVENVSANRFARTARLVDRGNLKPSEIEGGGGRVSQQLALSALRASEEMYLVAEQGLCRLVAAQSPALDRALRAAFARSITAVSDLNAPLEEAAERDRAR